MLSVLTCVSGRPTLFAKHLGALADQATPAVEYVAGMWQPIDGLREMMLSKGFGQVTSAEVPVTRWWMLPAAYNAGLSSVSGDRVLIIGSDVIAGKGLIETAQTLPLDGDAWCFRVINSDGREFVGPARRVAIP